MCDSIQLCSFDCGPKLRSIFYIKKIIFTFIYLNNLVRKCCRKPYCMWKNWFLGAWSCTPSTPVNCNLQQLWAGVWVRTNRPEKCAQKLVKCVWMLTVFVVLPKLEKRTDQNNWLKANRRRGDEERQKWQGDKRCLWCLLCWIKDGTIIKKKKKSQITAAP